MERKKHTKVVMEFLIEWLLMHGWDYTKLPEILTHYSHRTLQRAWHKRSLPTEALNTHHVSLALLEVDPPRFVKRHRTA